MYRHLNTVDSSAPPSVDQLRQATAFCSFVIATFLAAGMVTVWYGNERGGSDGVEWMLSGAMLILVAVALAIYSAVYYGTSKH